MIQVKILESEQSIQVIYLQDPIMRQRECSKIRKDTQILNLYGFIFLLIEHLLHRLRNYSL